MFACVHAPEFPVQAVLRSERESTGLSGSSRAVAVLDGPASLLRIFACNELARQHGVLPGITKLQAESFAQVELRQRSADEEESAQAALLDCAGSFSSQVESTAPGSVLVDISGTRRLFGPPTQLAIAMSSSARESGLHTNVAVAANPDTAFYAARGFAGVTVIQPGEEEARLADLPLAILNIPPDVLSRLASMGILTFGALAKLPSVPLSQRFGQLGIELQSITRGKSYRQLVPAKQTLRFVETFEFEDPIEDIEPLAFILNRLLDQLVERLRERSLGTTCLRVQLELEARIDRNIHDSIARSVSATLHESSIKLPVPTQEQGALLKLLHLDLAEHPPAAPVKRLLLEAQPAALRSTQGGLFDRIAPHPEQLQVLLARARGIVGENDSQGRSRVGAPVVVDTHSPDAFALKEFSIVSDGSFSPGQPRLAVRIYRPPLPASVRVTDGKPFAISFDSRPSSSFKIVAASGPWRTSGAWSEGTGRWERDEWDIALMGERIELYRIYHDGKKRWFVDGMYD